MARTTAFLSCILLAFTLAAAAEPVEVTADLTLDPAKPSGPLVIKASNITIDGRGAWITGAAGEPKTFKGIAISAAGVSNVTLKNINAKGWETGLSVADGSGWTIENCNFSDNFHDPEFGWGEHGRRGGIVLRNVQKSTLRGNKANRVWDAAVLVDSNGNTLEGNDFSHTSNTCLKLWHSCRNTIRKNDLGYGIRIKPGEVHARDSTCVLIESGSNDNRLADNDITHGGDGLFVRVLNNWVSTGNIFENNDCSYANNNCVEAWSPRNTYIRNKANHGSYGFWLGASDQTVLIGNEASHNGEPAGMHNSPHLPNAGHAGIVFMFGPSSHTIVRGNTCEANNGAGIAVIGDIDTRGAKWRAFHWIIEQNTLTANRWGIYAGFADWVDIAANTFKDNSEANLRIDGWVANLVQRADNPKIALAPKAVLNGPSFAKVGQKVILDASHSTDPDGNPLSFRWFFGDGAAASTPRVEHAYKLPGFYRVGLTVNNPLLSDLAWRDFYVTEDVAEIGTEGAAAQWSWVDPQSKVAFSNDKETRLCGESSLSAFVSPYSGGRVSLLWPAEKKAGLALAGKTSLVFWLKATNENIPAWQDVNPVVTMYESADKSMRLSPKDDLLSHPPYNEAREGWIYIVVPLAGDAMWKREGQNIDTANWLTVGFDSWGTPPLRIWVDGMALK